MSKLEIIVLSGVVYRIKSTGPSTEPRATPYESVTLFDRLSLFFTRMSAFFASKKKNKFDPAHRPM